MPSSRACFTASATRHHLSRRLQPGKAYCGIGVERGRCRPILNTLRSVAKKNADRMTASIVGLRGNSRHRSKAGHRVGTTAFEAQAAMIMLSLDVCPFHFRLCNHIISKNDRARPLRDTRGKRERYHFSYPLLARQFMLGICLPRCDVIERFPICHGNLSLRLAVPIRCPKKASFAAVPKQTFARSSPCSPRDHRLGSS